MSTLLGYFFLALGVSFICSTLESVILSVTHSHIGTLVKTNHRSGKLLQALKDDINRPLAAILTLNTIANTVGAAGVGAQALHVFGSGAVALATGILTFCILIFSEIIPKTIGATYWRKLASPSAYLIRILMVITFPFVWLSKALSAKLTPDEDEIKKVSREEITAMAEMGEDEGSIDEQESDIIENLFRLKEMNVDEILTPRSVIFALEDNQTVGQVMDAHEDINFSRIPIFHENIDEIIGIVYKDTLLETMADDYFEKSMADIVDPVDWVYEEQTVESVLNKFTKTRSHMFIVKDEFGGTTGLVTLEDCIETLLGVEIMDESDEVADMRELAKDQLRQKRRAEENGE
ncbi:MAG: hemolysin family protein [Candidatus Marinimicrobia bacterium]|jgi:CBS domain containing-hemolysin-like protein|nr:hemolysin family protein [Candidatus Neomarinimicrobiota bacterium]MDP6611655.1 hemolysin family protein [Candidatus Neomarinimicrobiota bacterium]|tara:strand:- start:9386 stop:10432 length:1047 start_codon:yes stop_codon:yes gene_type:complete